MKTVTVDGTKYKVTEYCGFNHDINSYQAFVLVAGKEKVIVRPTGGKWKFWTAEDRVDGKLASCGVGQ